MRVKLLIVACCLAVAPWIVIPDVCTLLPWLPGCGDGGSSGGGGGGGW